jgi:pyruvate-formate lyase-activating enzyme
MVDVDDILKVILADPFADVTFSGGDPMFKPEGFTALARAVKDRSGKNIWAIQAICLSSCCKIRGRGSCLSISTCLWTGALSRL